MYYKDLSPYRDGGADSDDMLNVYPEILNVGWLGTAASFPTGLVRPELVDKLTEMTFLDLIDRESVRHGFANVNIHMMHVRGAPYGCPFCEPAGREIRMRPDRLKYYSGSEDMVLGRNEMCIPAADGVIFYSFPTMLVHYIKDHGYLPPKQFLDALEAFDLDKPYDVEVESGNLRCVEVLATSID